MNEAKTETSKAPAPKRVKVKLAKNHSHAGIDYVKDEIIEVVEHIADWIEKHEIGKRYGGSEPAKNAAKN